MKKIMFNDRYGLTEAVLSGRKTQTRRICKEQYWSFSDIINANENQSFIFEQPKYKIGEVVAVAQCYKEAGVDFLPEEDEEFGCHNFPAEQTNGWTNKMFVRSDLMPNRIRITNVRLERLQEISDEDCIKEGIEEFKTYYVVRGIEMMRKNAWGQEKPFPLLYSTPQSAYEALIDRISGKGTWESNPWVFVYDFQLVK